MEYLKGNFDISKISPHSWRKSTTSLTPIEKLLSSDSKLSLSHPQNPPTLSHLPPPSQQLEILQSKYGIEKPNYTVRKIRPKKKGSILHKTLEGLLRKNIIDTDLFKHEKSNDFFSVNRLSSYINNLSRRKDLNIH